MPLAPVVVPLVVPVVGDPAAGAPAPEVPPTELPPLCANASVLVSVSAAANPMLVSFMSSILCLVTKGQMVAQQ
jgi:hypothetical protein